MNNEESNLGGWIIVLLSIIMALILILFAERQKVANWQERYNEQFEYVYELKAVNKGLQGNFETAYQRLQEKQNEYDKLNEWATSTYCNITVGNAHIEFNNSGATAYRSIWQMYIKNELIKRPPVDVVDCRGE